MGKGEGVGKGRRSGKRSGGRRRRQRIYLQKLQIDLCLFFRAGVVNKPISLFSQVWNEMDEQEENHTRENWQILKESKLCIISLIPSQKSGQKLQFSVPFDHPVLIVIQGGLFNCHGHSSKVGYKSQIRVLSNYSLTILFFWWRITI